MHDPLELHLHALKRNLCYIHGILDHVQLHVSPTSDLRAYFDAAWGGCHVSRRSTSSYCVFLGDNLISWSSNNRELFLGLVSRHSFVALLTLLQRHVGLVTYFVRFVVHQPKQPLSIMVTPSRSTLSHPRTKRRKRPRAVVTQLNTITMNIHET